ncbi:hypothetical protein M2131_001522 [Polynucleobacter sphagniphilus]|uniref:hypothetical protein n=1 Tax=Polynucleobacter sphagniphilus TaxID=1743169 RepID=UPI0024749F38|nr:hypothetical protein [Polynucleobacter sphagniphilus]MDH6421581.1 hypothetical protein [Polynucleobacter sphagniphilus]
MPIKNHPKGWLDWAKKLSRSYLAVGGGTLGCNIGGADGSGFTELVCVDQWVGGNSIGGGDGVAGTGFTLLVCGSVDAGG